MNKVLFIEGGSKGNYTFLRQAFSDLLGKEVTSRPKIKACGPDTEAAKDYKASTAGLSWALIDMDGLPNERSNRLGSLGLTTHEENVHFMVQEMEAWFLSQPEVLKAFYGIDFSDLLNKDVKQISKPGNELQKRTKAGSTKGPYVKLKHDFSLISMLDTKKLMNDFEDFKNLVTSLNQVKG